MAVNLSVLSSFDASGLNKAQGELEKLQGSVSNGMDSLLSSAKVMGAGIIAAGVAAGGALFAMGSSIDQSYDNIRVKTGATGAALDAFKNDVRAIVGSVPTSFGDAGQAVAAFATKLGLSGPQLQGLSSQVLELSRITGTDLGSNLDSVAKVMQNFSVGADQQSASLDFLFRASQKSGIGVGQLSASMADTGVQLRAMGFSFDQSAALVATMGKAGVDVSSIMPGLNKALALAAKEGKSAGQVFSETFDKIKNSPNDIAASQAALEIFGKKGGVGVAQMIREGKLSYDDMLASISGGSDTIMQASADTMDFGEKFDLLKNKALLALEPIATKVFDAIGNAIERVSPIVDEIIGSFKAFFAAFKAGDGDITSTGMAGVFERIGLIAREAFDIAAGAIQWVKDNLEIVLPIVGSLGAAFLLYKGYLLATEAATKIVTIAQAAFNAVMSANPIMLVIIAIALLIAGAIYAYRHFETFRNVVNAAFKGIQTAIAFAWENVIKPIWSIIVFYITDILIPYYKMLWTIAQAVFAGISSAVSFAWNNIIKPIWDAIYGFIVNYLIPYVQFLWDIYSAIWGYIGEKIQRVWSDIIQPIWQLISAFISDVLVPIFNFLSDIVSTVWDAISGAISSAWDVISSVFSWITGAIGNVIDVFKTIGSAIGDALGGIADLIKAPFQTAFNFIVDAWNNTIGGLEFTIPSWVPVFGGDGFTVPKLDHWYHTGGVVDGPLGSNVPAMLQAGEMVLTQRQQAALLNGNSSGGTSVMNVTVNMPPGSNGSEVVNAIKRYEKTNGTSWRN